MPKHKDQTIPVTLHLTKEQIEELLRQVTKEQDWLDDPRILQMLTDRDRRVTTELQAGQIVTLAELQARWAKSQKRSRKRSTS